jgi:catechol 2,3-dioxygenase
MAERWGAAFVSAGGYHHHLGLNTWAGQGAPPRPAGAAGLRHYTIELPDEPSLAEVAARLTAAGVALAEHPDGGWWLEDPSRNRIHLTVRAGAN